MECVSNNVRNLLHLPDGLSAEASEGVGRDALDVAVFLQVPEQHIDRNKHMFNQDRASERTIEGSSSCFHLLSLVKRCWVLLKFCF